MSSPRSKKPYAFLDLDNTVIDTEANFLNEALLEVLLENEVTDICLFTSMDAQQISGDIVNKPTYSRVKIIEELESRGFKVRAVITPPDIYYSEVRNEPPGYYYKNIWKPKYEEVYKNNLEGGNKSEKIIDEKELLAIQAIDIPHMEKISNLQKQLFEEQSKPIEAQDEKKIKDLNDQIAANVSHKGKMFDVVLKHKETIFPDMGHIIYAEDLEKERVHVTTANDKARDKAIPITLIPIQERNTAQKILNDVPNINTIATYESRKEDIKKRYENLLPSELKEYINKLNANRASFLDKLSNVVGLEKSSDNSPDKTPSVAKSFWKSLTRSNKIPGGIKEIQKILSNKEYTPFKKCDEILKIIEKRLDPLSRKHSYLFHRHDQVTQLYEGLKEILINLVREKNEVQFDSKLDSFITTMKDKDQKRIKELEDTFNIKENPIKPFT